MVAAAVIVAVRHSLAGSIAKDRNEANLDLSSSIGMFFLHQADFEILPRVSMTALTWAEDFCLGSESRFWSAALKQSCPRRPIWVAGFSARVSRASRLAVPLGTRNDQPNWLLPSRPKQCSGSSCGSSGLSKNINRPIAVAATIPL